MPHAIVTYIISLTSIPPWEIIRYMVHELDGGWWMCMSSIMLGWLGAITTHGREMLTRSNLCELSFFEGICFLGGVEGFFFPKLGWMKWGEVGFGDFSFPSGLFLHIFGVFWVGRDAIFSIPKGFFWGGVGRVWLFLKGGVGWGGV
jgi:hypothetical protein